MVALKFVAQKNRSSGCGPACIAMLAGSRLSKSPEKAYEKAIHLIFGEERSRDLYTTWKQLQDALDDLSIKYADRIHLHRSWKTITTLSIVKCGTRGNEDWHWAIYDGRDGTLYDPLKKGPTRPNGRGRKPRSHLPIYL